MLALSADDEPWFGLLRMLSKNLAQLATLERGSSASFLPRMKAVHGALAVAMTDLHSVQPWRV